MSNPLTGKQIILGVTGSIAAYKAADLASKLTQMGALVDVILTQSGQQFVTPLTFQSVTGRQAFVDANLWDSGGHVRHIGLGQQADLIVIAPATANTIAKLANGIADNLLTVTSLAGKCPILVAPAMDGGMYQHAATQANIHLLMERGVQFIGPAEGHLASGQTGVGRMEEPYEILGAIRWLMSLGGPLANWQVMVTAGGTQEAIDPVRTISNRSSGKQGYALAQAAIDLGAEVTLITGPTNLHKPFGCKQVKIQSAREMLEAVLQNLEHTDILLMAAAVADFRPSKPAADKIKKSHGIPTLELVQNPDILEAVANFQSTHYRPDVVIGFAAESQDLISNARSKLQEKNLDAIVANDINAPDAGFEVDTNRITIFERSGKSQEYPLMSKELAAEEVLKTAQALVFEKPILHICSQADWENAQSQGVYKPSTFEEDGFIHFSKSHQVLTVANTFYTGREDLLLLWTDPSKFLVPVCWELVDDQLFPHLYALLNLDAVISVHKFDPEADGKFQVLPTEHEQR